MSKNLKLSIVLPVYNEKDNLSFLIPQLDEVCNKLCSDYEIIVVDDNSNDGTLKLMNTYSDNYYKVKHVVRHSNMSLPLSILEGIQKSIYENVMWLDADGSMDSSSVEVLINEFKENSNNFVVGSRFAQGGGYKGQTSNDKNIYSVFKNIKNSEDSFLAIYLSIFFNRLLKQLLATDVTDLTSGFIIGKKSKIKSDVFTRSNYGEYFIYLITDLLEKNEKIIEVGYLCNPRQHGNSKTSNNLVTLIRLGLPYIKVALTCRQTMNIKKRF